MLAQGTMLGPYRILAPLGAGGMGEVYRAHDTRLGRDVAVKVLASHLAATPEVRARFEREARTISQLNHPHICTLHDVGHQDGLDYLVMELLEGETLAHRLEKGPLQVPEVLALGSQIADALNRAHRAGVVHRDLKPANVMLTAAGAKLMDFGLARAHVLAPTVAAMTESPTVSRPLTAEGTIVGTFQYMAPEQLEGKEADARADLWALGCVLYEMTTGHRAFEGRSQASLISAIMSGEPAPPSLLAPLTPPALERLIHACLAKDPEERVQTAHDARLELTWIAGDGSRTGGPAAGTARRRGRERLAWVLAAVGFVVAGSALAALQLRRPARPRVVRFDVSPPEGMSRMSWPRVSPDGRAVAFRAFVWESGQQQKVWIRELDSVGIHALEEVTGDVRPFWSPDSRYLAFISAGKLRKAPVGGGPAITICDVPGGADGTWGKKGWILFDGDVTDSIRGVPAGGGAPRAITTLDRRNGETGHAWPHFLPDGEHFLFVASRLEGPDAIRMGRLGSRETRHIGYTEGRVEYAPPGYLVYITGSTLVAQRFDARSARTTGEPVPLGTSTGLNRGDFSVSSAGVLAFRETGPDRRGRLLWVERDGSTLGEAAPPGYYEDVALSPDGSRVALSVVTGDPGTRDIWVRDLARGVNSRITFDPGDEIVPVWSPDGTRICYSRIRGGLGRCCIRAANGAGETDSLGDDPGHFTAPTDWSGAANSLVMSYISSPQRWDIWVMPSTGPPVPRPFLQSSFDEGGGRLSPDGRWLAYSSNESGQNEIFVVAYPGPGDKWQVTTGGGSVPQWRADGRELFFRRPDQSIMAVDVRPGSTFEVGVPRPLFKIALTGGPWPGYRWAVSRDGQRFLVNTPSEEAATERLTVVTNWTGELRRR